MRKLLEWLAKPDGYETSPLGYVANQLGHYVLGYLMAMVLGWYVALFIYFAWECFHISRGGSLYDSAEDYAFVNVGVMSFVTLSVLPVLVVTPFFMSGIFRRFSQ